MVYIVTSIYNGLIDDVYLFETKEQAELKKKELQDDANELYNNPNWANWMDEGQEYEHNEYDFEILERPIISLNETIADEL